MSNTIYCGIEECLASKDYLNKKYPTNWNNNNKKSDWNIEVAKYCSNIIYSISTAAINKLNPTYPTDLTMTKEFIDNTGDPVFGSLLKDDYNNLWLSFRGTLEKKEWIQDLEYQQETPDFFKGINQNSKPKIHKGFTNAYLNFRDDLHKALQVENKKKDKTLVVSGHSLGAGVATLVGADLKNYGYNVVVYTFASPRVGDNNFRDLVDTKLALPLYRVVNTEDIVPDLPPSVSPNFDSPNNPYMYAHCGKIIPVTINRFSILNNHLIPSYMAGLAKHPQPIVC